MSFFALPPGGAAAAQPPRRAAMSASAATGAAGHVCLPQDLWQNLPPPRLEIPRPQVPRVRGLECPPTRAWLPPHRRRLLLAAPAARLFRRCWSPLVAPAPPSTTSCRRYVWRVKPATIQMTHRHARCVSRMPMIESDTGQGIRALRTSSSRRGAPAPPPAPPRPPRPASSSQGAAPRRRRPPRRRTTSPRGTTRPG